MGFGSNNGLVVFFGVHGSSLTLHPLDIGKDDGNVELGEEPRDRDGTQGTSNSLKANEGEDRQHETRIVVGKSQDL